MKFKITGTRRAAALVLALIIVLGSGMTAHAEDSTAHADDSTAHAEDSFLYTDVSETDWFYPYVSFLSEEGVVDGYEDGSFKPDGSVSLGEALKLVLLAAGYGEKLPSGGHWAGGYLSSALSYGMLSEKTAEDLDKAADRLLIAQVASSALELTAPDIVSPFVDTEDGSVTALYQQKIIEGSYDLNGNLVFEPNSSISRAEISAIISRIKTSGLHEGQLKFGKYWVDIIDTVPKRSFDLNKFVMQDGFMSYSDDSVKTYKGIDVSSHQDDIDWKSVADSGIDFAFIRVGYRGYGSSGSLNKDKNFDVNIKGAQKAGIKVGVYIYSTAVTVLEAVEEARFVVGEIENHNIDYPVVFDWEIYSKTARNSGVATSTLCAAANAFCDVISAAGYRPMIYFNCTDAYLHYDLAQISKYDFWLAQYAAAPTFYYDFNIWQYTSSGTVNGISKKVDLNISFVDYSK